MVKKVSNTLPECICNITGVSLEKFKSELDNFLTTVPDEPLIPGYTAMQRANSNSLIDMVGFGSPAPRIAADQHGRMSQHSPR